MSDAARDFLLEIGAEELPAGQMESAIAQLGERGRALLASHRLAYESLDATGTPRRLVLYVKGLAARQADRSEQMRGPAAAAAFDAQGDPTPAARGFARGQGVAVEDLTTEDTPAGRYVFALRRETGRPAAEVLAESLPGLVEGMEFPRSMRWGAGEARFARPVCWIVALLGGEVIPFRAAGVESGRLTRGHRVLGPGPHEIADPASYWAVMERACVIVDHRRRRDEVRRQAEAAAAAVGGRAVIEDELLDEVSFLVEWPTAFAGRFAPDYLALPREVLETPMKHHQRYFPVESPDGRLLNAFVGVRNGGRDHLDTVIAGNEKVLRARLADARFFFVEDRKRPLADYVDKLRGIVFQARLGTVFEKVERVRRLAAALAGEAGAAPDLARVVDRAALLCKADLGTSMVYEFTELQGIMGAEYARLSGEEEAVARAIHEHLFPRFAGDELPQTPAGVLLSVADKLDTIAGCFAAGIQPTGSADPYALRRQALGVTHILRGAGTGTGTGTGLERFSLDTLIRRALAGYEGREGLFAGTDSDAVAGAILDFFMGRIRVLMGEEGFRHEVIEAVLATGCDVPAELWRRVRALAGLAESPALAEAVAAHRRAANLAEKAETAEVRADLLRDDEERALADALARAEAPARDRAAAGDYAGYFTEYANLRPAVDRYLDKTMVMVDDEALRRNRLALLRRVADLGRAVADLGRLG